MKIIYFTVYCIYKGYEKLSPKEHDNWSQMTYAIAMLNFLTFFILLSIILPQLFSVFTHNRIIAIGFCIIFWLINLRIFKDKQWWLTNFSDFNQWTKNKKIALSLPVIIFITTVFITSIVWFLKLLVKNIGT